MEIQEKVSVHEAPIISEKEERMALFAQRLLPWFQTNKRPFPWRPIKNPYESAVAEILLQKTSATNAKPVYEQFLDVYPTLNDLAELLRLLGISRRAILKCGSCPLAEICEHRLAQSIDTANN